MLWWHFPLSSLWGLLETSGWLLCEIDHWTRGLIQHTCSHVLTLSAFNRTELRIKFWRIWVFPNLNQMAKSCFNEYLGLLGISARWFQWIRRVVWKEDVVTENQAWKLFQNFLRLMCYFYDRTHENFTASLTCSRTTSAGDFPTLKQLPNSHLAEVFTGNWWKAQNKKSFWVWVAYALVSLPIVWIFCLLLKSLSGIKNWRLLQVEAWCQSVVLGAQILSIHIITATQNDGGCEMMVAAPHMG